MPKRIEIKEKILNSYIDHLLIEGVRPVSVYKLCKKLKIEEKSGLWLAEVVLDV